MVDKNPRAEETSPVMTARRYPGVQPFGDNEIQRELFRGRDEEKYDLLQLVLAERLVLLFARSGIGKSSLISAGLLEPLRDQDYFPMVVRVSGSSDGPIESLYEGIRSAARTANERRQIVHEPSEPDWNKTSLWHFFKTASFWRERKLLSPVLIIDQFEELFTLYSTEERKQFIHVLSDLVRGIRPRDRGDESGPSLSDAPPEVKVVLALREDFYANLEELRQRIPAIYKAPFRLDPLSREKARRAIVEPAALEGENFSTPPFSWADDAVDSVLDFLSEQQLGEGKTKVGKDVEPFQLQLICQHVENIVGERNLITVTAQDLGGNDALKRVLSSFYEDSLVKICDKFSDEPDLRQRLEKLCEYGFITAKGRRLLREESTIMQEDQVSPKILRDMVELRLLRKEPRVGDNYYELTHDTLIEPIQLSRLDREARAARELEEARAREAQERAEQERKLRGRVRTAGVVALILLIIVGGVAVWKAHEARVTEAEKQVAVEAAANREKIAKQAADDAEKVADDAVEQSNEAKNLAENILNQANVATLQAEGATAARVVVETEVKLASLQKDKNFWTQQRVEAEKQLKQARSEAKRQEAENQLNQVKRQLNDIEQKAEGLKAKLGKAKLEKADASTRKVVDSQQQESKQPAKLTGSGEAKGKLQEVKQELKTIAQKAEVQKAKLEEVERATAETSTQEPAVPDTGAEDSSPGEAPEQSSAGQVPLSQDETAGQSTEEVAADLEAKLGKLSVCEQFDFLEAFEPRSPFGPEAEFKLKGLAELNALSEKSAVVVTQKNLVAGATVSNSKKCEALSPGESRSYKVGETVCFYAWISSPGDNTKVRLVIKDAAKKEFPSRLINIGRNRLRGERMGYRIWHAKTVRSSGEHEILLYNRSLKKNRLICRNTFNVE